jgi:cell division septum initiation protein DivIVA
MEQQQINPQEEMVNEIINDLSNKIAALTKENSILVANLKMLQKQLQEKEQNNQEPPQGK